jgi:hypothetical protein
VRRTREMSDGVGLDADDSCLWLAAGECTVLTSMPSDKGIFRR